jgi:hypothetical protein
LAGLPCDDEAPAFLGDQAMNAPASQPENTTPPAIPLATFAPPAPVPTERIVNLGPKLKFGLVAALFVGSLLCCFVTTWYTASERAARLERERIADEFRKGFQGFFGQQNGVNPVPGEKVLEVPYQKPAEIEKMRIELVSGSIGKLTLTKIVDGEPTFRIEGGKVVYSSEVKRTKSDKEYLQIKFKITNATDNFVFNYGGLGSFASSIGFKDEFGNRYAKWDSGGYGNIEGAGKKRGRIDPGQSVEDIVAFELPIPNAKEFTFEIPSNELGRPDGQKIVFKIPRSWFEAATTESTKELSPPLFNAQDTDTTPKSTKVSAPVLFNAQDTYTIKVKVGGKGTFTLVTKEQTMDQRIFVANDGNVLESNLTQKEATKYTEEIVEQAADRTPTKVRRVYEKSLVSEIEIVEKNNERVVDRKKIDEPQPYHGKVLLIEIADGEPTFRIEGGKELSAKSVPSLKKEFSKKRNFAKEMEETFPKKAIAVGESWSLDMKLIEEEKNESLRFADFDRGIGTAKLAKVYKKNGKVFGVFESESKIPVSKTSDAYFEFKPGCKAISSATLEACIDGTDVDWVLRCKEQLKGEVLDRGKFRGGLIRFEASTIVSESHQEVKK